MASVMHLASSNLIRHILDLFIFLARHMPVTFVMCLLGSWLGARYWGQSHSGHRNLRLAGIVLAATLLLIFPLIGIWYLRTDGFAGEVEPIVSSLAWLVQGGHPLYTAFDAAERYSVLYGPAVFLTNGLFLKLLGPTLASAKVASLLGGIGSLLFLYGAVSRERRDAVALGATTLATLYFWTQGFAVYLVRPDALLLFAVGLGLFGAVRLRRWLALATVAAAVGFAINLKVHGGLYFVPVLGLVWRRFGWRDTIVTSLGAVAVVGAPFLFHDQISLRNYLGWLRNAVSHGLELSTLDQTLRYAVFLLLPPLGLLLAVPGRYRLWSRFGLDVALLLPVYGLILVLAAKPGAGPVHLLPLVPTTVFLFAEILRASLEQAAFAPLERTVRGSRQWLRPVLVATVATALLAGSVNIYRAVRYVDYEINQTPHLAEDVQEIMREYPDLTISMACGGERLSFQATWLRPLLVFADNPVLIDPISVMDSSLSGRQISQRTYQALTDGKIAVWLVPRRQIPFAKRNWYSPHLPLFSERFQEHFMACYTPRAHSRYFDLRFWNGLTDGENGPVLYAGSGASDIHGLNVAAPVSALSN